MSDAPEPSDFGPVIIAKIEPGPHGTVNVVKYNRP